MKSSTLLITAAALVAVAGIAVGAVMNSDSSSPAAGKKSDLSIAPAHKGYVKGGGSTVALVEYSDFQCPACRAYDPVVKKLVDQYEDRVTLEYRHFPLGRHLNALPAALAAEAAGKQGKFWEMHDILFERQREWAASSDPDKQFIGYAEEIGLDGERFGTDLESKELAEKIKAQYQSGTSAGVGGTPTFFVNGRKIDNPGGLDEFKTIIESELAERAKQN